MKRPEPMSTFESDWKHYSKIIDVIVERYYSKINLEIKKILEDKTQTEKEKKIKIFDMIYDADELLDRSAYKHARSRYFENVLCLITNKIMSLDDISGFSNEFQDDVKRLIK